MTPENRPNAPTIEPASDVLTPKQAAKYLHLSHRTLETMRTRGNGPAFAKYGEGRSARVVYRRCDLDGWIASRVRQSTTAA
jgi:hypothetical protein